MQLHCSALYLIELFTAAIEHLCLCGKAEGKRISPALQLKVDNISTYLMTSIKKENKHLAGTAKVLHIPQD